MERLCCHKTSRADTKILPGFSTNWDFQMQWKLVSAQPETKGRSSLCIDSGRSNPRIIAQNYNSYVQVKYNSMFLGKTNSTARVWSCSKCSCNNVLNLDLSGGHRHCKNATFTFFFKKHEVKIKLRWRACLKCVWPLPACTPNPILKRHCSLQIHYISAIKLNSVIKPGSMWRYW